MLLEGYKFIKCCIEVLFCSSSSFILFSSVTLYFHSLLYFILRTSYFIMAESSNTPLASSGRNWAYSFWQFWTPIDTCMSFYTATGKY